LIGYSFRKARDSEAQEGKLYSALRRVNKAQGAHLVLFHHHKPHYITHIKVTQTGHVSFFKEIALTQIHNPPPKITQFEHVSFKVSIIIIIIILLLLFFLIKKGIFCL
jgi:hypothetical protein